MAAARHEDILENLRRFEAKFDCVNDDFQDLRQRLKQIEPHGSEAEVILAGISARLDQVDERLHRIEHRLDLVILEIETGVAGLNGLRTGA